MVKLETDLQKPLPGKEAQARMSATLRNPNVLTFDWSDPPRPGAVLILLYPYKGEIFIPLMKRSDYGGVHSGQISLPGGKMEDTDTDLVTTALREAEEEIGVPRNEIRVVGKLTPLFVYASNFNILPVVGTIDRKPDFRPDQREVVEVIEAPLSHLEAQGSVKNKELVVRNFKIQAPYYDVNEHVVWGATAMMLSEFLEVIAQNGEAG